MPLRERRRRPAAHARHADRGDVPNRTARPSFASQAPKTMRPMCVWMHAPAHIGHGSNVTTSVQSARFQSPRACAASRIASISACANGSCPASRRLRPGRSPCLARRAPRHRPARHPASRRALPAQSPRTSPRQVRPCAQFIEIALSKLADTKSEPPFSNTSTFVSASFESAIHEQPPIRHHADAVY